MIGVDQAGRMPLHSAALENDIVRVNELLAHGADPNSADADDFTPLHFASQQGALEAARILLNNGAAVDPTNVHGNTPLWMAVFSSKGKGELIQLLRSKGADPFHRNRAGKTPVGLARQIANYDVARFFADLPGEPRNS
jgi:ankyrin repeat protein